MRAASFHRGECRSDPARLRREMDRTHDTMTDAVMVSVVLLTYNHARFIRHALQSVLAQQAPFGIEVLIVDDASTDGTSEIVTDAAGRSRGRVRVIQSPVNV